MVCKNKLRNKINRNKKGSYLSFTISVKILYGPDVIYTARVFFFLPYNYVLTFYLPNMALYINALF